jgi:hypothetical protein
MFVLPPFIPGWEACLHIPETPGVSMRLCQVALRTNVVFYGSLHHPQTKGGNFGITAVIKMMQQKHATMSAFAVVCLFSDHGLHRCGDLGYPSMKFSFPCYLLALALKDLL